MAKKTFGVAYRISFTGNPYFMVIEDGKTMQVLEPEAFATFVEKCFNIHEEELAAATETYEARIKCLEKENNRLEDIIHTISHSSKPETISSLCIDALSKRNDCGSEDF